MGGPPYDAQVDETNISLTTVNAEKWDNVKKITLPLKKWDNYELFKNNWEHNVPITITGLGTKPMWEWFLSKDGDIVDAIFRHYKLKIEAGQEKTMADLLYEVIIHKRRNVGVKIQENSIRMFP